MGQDVLLVSFFFVLQEVCLVEGEFGSGSSSLVRGRSSVQELVGGSGLGPSLAATLYGEGLLSLVALRCSVCLAGFPSGWLLEQHLALQHPTHHHLALPLPAAAHRTPHQPLHVDKPFRCDQCGQSYRYRSAYLKHREQNHRARLPADKLFTCDVCGMQFRYLKSFKKHRLNHALERLHARPPDREKREEEEEEVTSSNEVARATPAAVEQDDTVDSVTLGDSAECGGSGSLLGLLSGSTAPAGGERQRPARSFACPFCGKCVRSKENLKLHVRKHTGERPFACLFCGRAFGGKSDLTRHLRIHTGERPYHCEMCGKCFARADYLSKHLTTHIHQGHHP